MVLHRKPTMLTWLKNIQQIKTYEVGTVVTITYIRISAEMTACDENGQPLGVISENPAFLMNKDADGQSIALVGRVPVKVSRHSQKR